MANWISYIKDDLGSGGTTRDGMITDGPTHGVQLSQELPPLVGFTTIGSAGTLHVAGTIKLDGQLKDGDNDFGSSGQVLSSDGTDTKWVNAGSLSAGAASLVAINDDSNANASRYLTFVDSSSGNNSVKTDPQLTYNPSTNIITTAGVDLGDDQMVRFGGSQDLLIYHDENNSIISNKTGELLIDCDTINIRSYDGIGGTGETFIHAVEGSSGHVKLFHNGNQKLSTTSTGITVTGTVAATAFTGALTGNVTGNASGNAGSATVLQTARNIGGVSFNGSANINLPGVNATGSQDTSGNASTATILAASRNFSITGEITANVVSFNGSGNVALSATIDDDTVDEANLKISNGGTNGQFLCKRSGNTGGLTWEDVTIPSANTLSGSTLASGVTVSSLTSLGTLSSLSVSGNTTVTGTSSLATTTATGDLLKIGDDGTTNTKLIAIKRSTSRTTIPNIQGVEAGVGAGNFELQGEGGNVAIGDVSPSEKLHVVGGVRITGAIKETL